MTGAGTLQSVVAFLGQLLASENIPGQVRMRAQELLELLKGADLERPVSPETAASIAQMSRGLSLFSELRRPEVAFDKAAEFARGLGDPVISARVAELEAVSKSVADLKKIITIGRLVRRKSQDDGGRPPSETEETLRRLLRRPRP